MSFNLKPVKASLFSCICMFYKHEPRVRRLRAGNEHSSRDWKLGNLGIRNFGSRFRVLLCSLISTSLNLFSHPSSLAESISSFRLSCDFSAYIFPSTAHSPSDLATPLPSAAMTLTTFPILRCSLKFKGQHLRL